MFTKKEKNIILIIALVLLLGAIGLLVRIVLKKQRPLSSRKVNMEESYLREDEQRSESAVPSEPVNINTAGLMEIEALPFLGIEKAKDILEYRDKNGPFLDLDDLTKVSGIGKKTLEKLKPLITI